jgi:hypothetical protein
VGPSHETIRGADEAIFLAYEKALKRRSAIKDLGQTTGFDHVGIRHQLGLPPVLQEISGRRAQPRGAESPVGLSSVAATVR